MVFNKSAAAVPKMRRFSRISAITLGVAVADAHPLVCRAARLVTTLKGGEGAVREVCDLLLQANGKLESAIGASV